MVVVVPCLSVGPYRPEVTVCRRDLHVEGLRAELVRGRVDQPEWISSRRCNSRRHSQMIKDVINSYPSATWNLIVRKSHNSSSQIELQLAPIIQNLQPFFLQISFPYMRNSLTTSNSTACTALPWRTSRMRSTRSRARNGQGQMLGWGWTGGRGGCSYCKAKCFRNGNNMKKNVIFKKN